MKSIFKSTPFLRSPCESLLTLRGWLFAILGTGLPAVPAMAQTTAFTYQGKLTDGSAPASGLHDFEFKLHADNGGAAQVGNTVSVEDVNVTGGLFTVTLDFGGAVFDGRNRWLEIAVRPGASTGAYTTLDPRQAITSTPYAVKALEAAQLPAGAVTGAMLAPGAVSQLGAPDGSPANALQVDANGLVGVGTNAPAAGLHITASQSFVNAEQLAVRVDESGGYTRLDGATAVVVQDNLAAVAGYFDSGITLLDVSNPANPVMRSQFRDGEGAFTLLAGPRRLAMKPGLLAVGAQIESAVTLIDVSNSASPVKLADIKDGIDGWDELLAVSSVAINGNLMAIGAFSAVTLADITNPAAPVKWVELKDGFSGFDFLGGGALLAFSGAPGNLLAIAASNDRAVTVVDVTNPANPVKRAELRDGVGGFNFLDDIIDVKFSGNLLAIASYFNSAVTLVDVTNAASPVKLFELRDGVDADSLGGAASLAFSGSQLAVAAAADDAVIVFDVSHPASPSVLAVARHGSGVFTHLDQPLGLTFAGPNLIVTAQTSDALTTMQLAARSAGLSSQAWVGIGTARPAGALHVVGDVFVEQSNYVRLQSNYVQLETPHFAAGDGSIASGQAATALGFETEASGVRSTASGDSTTASGRGSTAVGDKTIASGDFSTAMGSLTEARGTSSTSMGEGTIASGNLSTAMGERSYASGFASTALGSNARASHDGTFVWSDRSPGEFFASTAANQFSVRATGGVRLQTGGVGLTVDGRPALLAPGSGQSLGLANDTSLSFGNQTRQMINLYNADYAIGVQNDAAYFRTGNDFYWYRGGSHSETRGDAGGGVPLMSLSNAGNLTIAGTLSSASDRTIKQGFAEVDPRAVLEKVVALPVQTWIYKNNPDQRHLGPVAQDFHAAFGLNGDDDKHIATVDADGVALAAIKGLNEKVEERSAKTDSRIQKLEAGNADGRIQKLEAAMQSKDARIAELEKRLAAIEALLKK